MFRTLKEVSVAMLFAAALVGGCAQNRVASGKMPGGTEGNGTERVQAPPSVPFRYIVEKHDCLWAIAGKPNVYGDPFQWPLIFKENRDEIKDPDLIYPRQVLRIQKGLDPSMVERARKEADETAKYQPHSQPRETQVVNYF